MGSETPGEYRRLSIESQDEVPPTFGVSLAVDVVEPTATYRDPPRVAITMTNEAERSQAYRNSYAEVFGGVVSSSESPGLVLLEPGYPVRLGEAPLRPERGSIAFDAALVRTELEANERKRVAYDVWDAPNNDGDPLSPGRYRFEDTYRRRQDTGDDEFTWGFVASVRPP